MVRRVQYTDWHEVRERMERGASTIFEKGRETVKEVGEQGQKAKDPVFASASVRGREG